jgi:hypothetical protein
MLSIIHTGLNYSQTTHDYCKLSKLFKMRKNFPTSSHKGGRKRKLTLWLIIKSFSFLLLAVNAETGGFISDFIYKKCSGDEEYFKKFNASLK